MLIVTVIGLICGAWTFLFLMMELNDLWEAKGFRERTNASFRLIIDILLTMGITALFGLGGGMLGVMLGLMASGFVSTFLFNKRSKK